ncbi:CCB3/YggT, partial [Dillenia turbinata]
MSIGMNILFRIDAKGCRPLITSKPSNFHFLERYRNVRNTGLRPKTRKCNPCCVLRVSDIDLSPTNSSTEILDTYNVAENLGRGLYGTSDGMPDLTLRLVLLDLDPTTAKLVIPILGPFLSAFAFLFILRIVMSWYPKLPVGKFPYVLAYAPTEPFLIPTRQLIPPLGGVDVTPVVWFGLISFLNEILVGPQGLLVLLSQQFYST